MLQRRVNWGHCMIWPKIAPFAFAIGMFAASPVCAQPTEAEPGLADLEFVVGVLKEDYAGWPAKTKGAKREQLDTQVKLAKSRIASDPATRIHAISAFLDWFEDGHLFLQSNIVSPPDPYPRDSGEARPNALRNMEADFAIRRLSNQTILVRVPDFNLNNAERFRALLEENHDAITSTPNLLIDMRFNGGGSDATYEPLMAYLYTRPIYSIGAEIRRSKRNLSALEGYVQNEAIPEDTREFITQILNRAENSQGNWVGFSEEGFQIETFPKVYEFPKRVGILAEGAGSSGDQFVIDARFSRKVTLFGGPTAGVIDYSNVNAVAAPSGDFVLGYAMTRSLRLPEEPFDNVGIPPNIPFGDEVKDHVAAAQRWLERQVD